MSADFAFAAVGVLGIAGSAFPPVFVCATRSARRNPRHADLKEHARIEPHARNKQGDGPVYLRAQGHHEHSSVER
ncbi:hypothetical protein AU381_11130 [Sinorhizobium glycinis]|uniref:Uncharacterized protein n=1 Tax=Sinorhizobium glycinis TaxID=1472378 RepID=A0A178XXS1_9HYPH|nr:hypothetical protein [Sinorhizobium glycinis]OAP40080.1 hypothetical protein AU381_11130 [Sinorhizobium glycinis]